MFIIIGLINLNLIIRISGRLRFLFVSRLLSGKSCACRIGFFSGFALCGCLATSWR